MRAEAISWHGLILIEDRNYRWKDWDGHEHRGMYTGNCRSDLEEPEMKLDSGETIRLDVYHVDPCTFRETVSKGLLCAMAGIRDGTLYR